MAGPGVGKSLAMGHMAAYNLMCGYNVLYITLELAEEVLAQRIESNLMNIEMNQIRKMDRETYTSRMEKIKSKSHGRLIIKEYPTASASALTFKHLIEELKIKKKFIPQIIYVDYLNICASARFRSNSGNVNSYSYVKAIAEELRGLAVQFDVPLITATQVNRTGHSSSDFGMEDTSESFGLPMTADLFLALIQTEELAELNQIIFKQLKNRLNDLNYNKRFIIGVDKSRMKLYDVETSEQTKIKPEVSMIPDKKAKFANFK